MTLGNRRRWAVRGLTLLMYAAVAAYIVRFFGGLDWSVVSGIVPETRWLLAAASFALIHRVLVMANWGAVVRTLGGSTSDLLEFNLYSAKSWLGRYLPAKVGAVLGRMYLAPDLGVPASTLGIGALLEAALHVGVGLVVGSVILSAAGELSILPIALQQVSWLVPLAAAGLLAPPLVSKVIAAISRWRTGSDLERLPDIRARSWWLAVGLAVLASLVAGGSAVCVLRAFGMEQAFAHWSFVWASYSISASVGILAIFAPSGLGVREALLLPLFSLVASPEVALLATLSLRGLEVVIDLLYFGLSLCATRWARWRREELATR